MNGFGNNFGPDSTGRYGEYGVPQLTIAQSNSFLSRVFSWMFAGLLLTGLVGWYVASSAIGQTIVHSELFLFLLLAELGVVIYLSARIQQMDPGTATMLFLGYCALNGVTLSVIFLAYRIGDILNVLVTTAALFGVLAFFGATTKMDLRKVGSIAFAGLIAIIIAGIVNMFLPGHGLTGIISVIGVIVFAGLTAFRIQTLTRYGMVSYGRDAAMDTRFAIIGALGLYLDFVNMFLFLLRLMGDRRR